MSKSSVALTPYTYKGKTYLNSDDVRKDTTLTKEEKLKIISKEFRGR